MSMYTGTPVEVIDVIFRKYKSKPHTVIAIFAHFVNEDGKVKIYSKGEYFFEDYLTIMSETKKIEFDEYSDLLAEINKQGFAVIPTKSRYTSKGVTYVQH